jgi:hypothetical protein
MNDQAEPVLAGSLQRLIDQGTLTREQADAVRTTFHANLESQANSHPTGPSQTGGRDEASNSWTSILAEVGGYVGVAFVVAAAAALIGPNWDNFSQGGRVAILAVPGALLLLAAASVAMTFPAGLRWAFSAARRSVQGHSAEIDQAVSPALRRLIGALVLAGGALLGSAAAVIADSSSDVWIPEVVLVVWGLGYLLFRGVPLHLGTAVALTWTVLTVFDQDSDRGFAAGGLVLVFAAAAWALLAIYRLIEEQALAIAVAGVMAFTGGEIVATSSHEGVGYLLLGLLTVAGLVGYIRTRELSALGVGAATLAVLVPQAVIDYTEGSLGVAGGLLVSGLSVVAASVVAARLRHTESGPAQLV